MSDPLINLEAEADLLGSLLLENRQVDRIADILAPADFHEPVHGMIYETILQQVSLGKAASAVTLKGFFGDELEPFGGPGYLVRITGGGECLLTDVKDSAQYLAGLSMRRQMRAGLAVASSACADLTLPISEIVSHADEALSNKAGETIHQPSGADCFDELLASFGQDRQGVTCGAIHALDELLGPMRPKQLVIGAGRPGMGKTALALSYAIGAAKRGHGVLFVSLEMSSTELAARMAADMCFNGKDGVPFAAINGGNPNGYQRRAVAQAGSDMCALPFQVIDAGHLSTGRLNMLIRRHARRMKAQGHKLELVIVDYLQLLSPDSKGRSNYEAVSEVSRNLKAMAKDHGIAVFALAQLSREVEKRPDRRPQLSDLRDSGQIEQDADAVMFLLRQEYYLRQNEVPEGHPDRMGWEALMDKHAGKIEFIVAKRRNGVTGQAEGWFYGQYQAVRG